MSARVTTWPYRRAEQSRVSVGQWLLRSPTADVPIGAAIPDWDPTADMNVVRLARVDTTGFWADCGLATGTPLCVSAVWASTTTSLRGRGTSAIVRTPDARVDVPLGLALRGAELGGTLRLSVTVTLGTALERRPIVAFRAGTLLWEDVTEVRIEGGASRFPVEQLSFAVSGPQFPKGAAWRLDWEQRDDLELPVLGCIRLFLNQDHPSIRALVDQPERPDSKLLAALMSFDVTRSLVREALTNDAFAQREGEWPADSVGRVVTRLFKTHLSGLPVATLRDMMTHDPYRFDAILQDRLGILGQT